MPDFIERRKLARSIDRTREEVGQIQMPEQGWLASMRKALGMPAEYVAKRKGVSRNAIYQAEKSEKEGSISLKQMEHLAQAMGGKFVYAILPDGRIEDIKYQHAQVKAKALLQTEEGAQNWTQEEREDWVDDKAAELLHDMPSNFWETLDDPKG